MKKKVHVICREQSKFIELQAFNNLERWKKVRRMQTIFVLWMELGIFPVFDENIQFNNTLNLFSNWRAIPHQCCHQIHSCCRGVQNIKRASNENTSDVWISSECVVVAPVQNKELKRWYQRNEITNYGNKETSEKMKHKDLFAWMFCN